jgi:hypothetical protein
MTLAKPHFGAKIAEMSSRIIALVLSASLVCGLYAQSETDTRSDIEKQGIDYTDTFGDVKAKLTYWPHGETHSLVFSAVGPNDTVPPLNDQCRMLGKLLGRALKEHPRSKYDVGVGTMRDGLIEPLDRYLLASPGWDSKRGQASAGPTKSYAFVVESVNKGNIADPIAKVFAKYGYTLRLLGISKMNIQKRPAFNGARLPEFIWEWRFEAEQQGEPHEHGTGNTTH